MEEIVRDVNDYIKEKGLSSQYFAKLSKDSFLGESIKIMMHYANGANGLLYNAISYEDAIAYIDSNVA